MNSLDISEYLSIAKRRIYWIIIPFLCTLLCGFAYLLHAPKTYEAQTLILVQPQKVPDKYVRSVISSDIDARLKTISQQVTSRTNLERILKQFQLLKEKTTLNIEERVLLLKKNIKIDVSKSRSGEGSAFTISFRGPDPKRVKQVTDSLASNFISENLLIRESQALGTSMFLTDELESIKRRLSEKEEQLKEYRQKYMGALPDQLQTNLSVLGRLQMQLEQLHSSIRDAENRKLIIQKQIADLGIMQRQLAGAATPSPVVDEQASVSTGSGPQDLAELKRRLASLQARYTDHHPDVISLKKTISRIEKESPGTAEQSRRVDGRQTEETSRPSGQEMPVMEISLRSQLEQTEVEIRNFKAEAAKIDLKINQYQAKIDDTPGREQELLSLGRDYDNLKKLYESMLNRKLEADIAVNMEKKQQGEQFRIIDPAKEPLTPVMPNVPLISLMTVALGLGLGCGLAYFVEFMDSSFKAPKQLEKEFKIPVLVSIPIRFTEEEYRVRRRKRVAILASISLGFIFSAAATLFLSKGIQDSVVFLKNLLQKV